MNWTTLFGGGIPGTGFGTPGGFGAFNQTYRCFSVAYLHRPELECGGKIILPASALEQLARLRIDWPMLFELSNPVLNAKKTNCGVLEFTAPEGQCGIPYWMMQLLLIEEGGFIKVRNATLPKATYVKVQPHNSSFLDISNPKAVLENRLRNFAAMTQGDVIKIEYNDKNYYLSIVEVKPAAAVSIIETDVQLDFAPPLDYKEPSQPTKQSTQPVQIPTSTKQNGPNTKESRSIEDKILSTPPDTAGSLGSGSFKAFTGTGYSLKSKSPLASPANTSATSPMTTSNSKESKLETSDSESDEEEPQKDFKPFTGPGYKLKG